MTQCAYQNLHTQLSPHVVNERHDATRTRSKTYAQNSNTQLSPHVLNGKHELEHEALTAFSSAQSSLRRRNPDITAMRAVAALATSARTLERQAQPNDPSSSAKKTSSSVYLRRVGVPGRMQTLPPEISAEIKTAFAGTMIALMAGGSGQSATLARGLSCTSDMWAFEEDDGSAPKDGSRW